MLWELIGAAAAAGVASLVACRALMAAGPVDTPDEERKAHNAPTPTSGGVGIAAGYALGLIALAEFGRQAALERQVLALVWLASAISLVFLLIGFIDDNRALGPRLKVLAFTLLSLAAAITMGVVDALPLGGDSVWRVGLSFGLFGTALWVFTLVNCVNFMDGANGLAIGSMMVGITALGLIAVDQNAVSAAAICFCTAGALVGFLVWNFPHGRLFAGDSGALFAGAVAAVVSLMILARTEVSPFVPPILFMPILADALLTLAWRVKRRRQILVGHQEHFYQIAMRAGWSHARVSLLYWGAMAACGALGVWLAKTGSSALPWMMLVLLAGVAVAVSVLVRRYARLNGMS